MNDIEAQSANVVPMERFRWDKEELIRLGKMLDSRLGRLRKATVMEVLATSLLRIRTKTGETQPLVLNSVQQRFEKQRGRGNIVLKARQMGITTWIAARYFLKTITHPGTLTLEVAHTQDAAEEIFRIVHRFLDLMPEEFRRGPLRTSHANVRQLVFPEMDAQYCVVSAGDRNAGRGLTVQNLHCSELARWPGDAAETLAGLRAALTPDGEQVLESTPNGVGDCFHREWTSAEAQGMVRHFFPWWMEDAYQGRAVAEESLTEDERRLVEGSGLTLEQIGFRRGLRKAFGARMAQEYAEDSESCFLTSGDSVFELAAIEERMQSAPDAAEQRFNGSLQVWLPPLAGRRYLVAVDPAGGTIDGDFSAAQVVDLESGMQCAEFAGRVGGAALTELVTRLAREYNRAWLVVERNNHGAAILALAESVLRYEHIYEQKGEAGWLTTSGSRMAAVVRLGALLVERAECFFSRRLLAECRTFVHLPGGRTGARAGTHDDCVLAMAIAHAVREELVTHRR